MVGMRVAAASILFVIGLLGAAHADSHITVNPNTVAKSKLPPGVAAKLHEQITYCGPDGLLEEKKNPVCERWHLTSTAQGSTSELETYAQTYISNYPDFCTPGATASDVNCFFYGPKTACIAQAHVETLVNTGNQPKPYCPTGDWTNPQKDGYNCGWCPKDNANSMKGCVQSAPNKGKFLPGYVCDYGGTPMFKGIVPEAAKAVHCSEVMIDGPYSNHADTYLICGQQQTEAHKGMIFTHDQKEQIRAINRANNGGSIGSDFAGFCFPEPKNGCPDPALKTAQGWCIEPPLLNQTELYKPNSPEVHHILPKTDRRGCACGTNSMKNAAIISKRLNTYFSNQDRQTKNDLCTGMTEVEFANQPAIKHP